VHCKGPPGRSRSPDKACSLNPDNKHAAIKAAKLVTIQYFNILIIRVIQIFTSINFLIMKKQILILVFLVVTTFVTTSVFGQATHTSPPQAPPSCANDALHPIAGKPYDYLVLGAPATGTYTWWATTNANFITAGVVQNTVANVLVSPAVVPTTPAQYNSGTNTSGTINLSWGTDILAAAMGASGTPTFLSVYYTGTTCADNLKVFQVEPVNAFMVDITNVENATNAPLAYGAVEDQCYAKVQGASWAANKMTYDYGTNVLVYEVVASNFSGTWTPTFTLTGLQTGQTATIVWDYNKTFDSGVAGTPVTVTSGTVSGTPVSTSITDTSNGVSIFVKVTVANGTYEGLTNDPISLGVTGTNSAAQRDVLAADCTTATLASNTAFQTLNFRPTVTNNGTVVGGFEIP
jgi:hypothetical protein